MAKIFDIADNFENITKITRSAIVFPILLRILYGSGLRIEECCSLQWKDVDVDKGIITVCKAKNRKQRFVPIDDSLTETLRSYRIFVLREKICTDFLFESDKVPGQPLRQNSFYLWFSKALETAGIDRTNVNQQERGICPHCLRHTFTLKSFLKHEDNHERFEDYAPFLAAYLGHDSPKETEAYLRSNYTVYTQSHQRINDAIGNLFPEVDFDEV